MRNKARRLCNIHYLRLLRHGDVSHARRVAQHELPCTIEGCDSLRRARGLCSKHLYRVDKNGSPHVVSFHVEKHGMVGHPLYVTWSVMRQRCFNPNATGYERYGGRGITVCDRWRYSFSTFVADVGERPEGCTLDRINNDGDYEPGNVRWSTGSAQVKNTRRRSDSSSGHVGVSWDGRRNRWRAYRTNQGKRVELGSFDTKADALAARHCATVNDFAINCCPHLRLLRSAALRTA